jgi:hypothetical protein
MPRKPTPEGEQPLSLQSLHKLMLQQQDELETQGRQMRLLLTLLNAIGEARGGAPIKLDGLVEWIKGEVLASLNLDVTGKVDAALVDIRDAIGSLQSFAANAKANVEKIVKAEVLAGLNFDQIKAEIRADITAELMDKANAYLVDIRKAGDALQLFTNNAKANVEQIVFDQIKAMKKRRPGRREKSVEHEKYLRDAQCSGQDQASSTVIE